MPITRAFATFADTLARAVAPLAPKPETLATLAAASDLRTVARGEHLLVAGDRAEHLYQIVRGLLRYYVVDADGEERTGQFFDEGMVVTDVASFVAGAPATQSIEALEETEVLRIPRAALYTAYDTDHAVERFGRLAIEQALMGAQRRSASLLVASPAERYRSFVTMRPEVARRVPQYLVASYLGITPEALSRIRRRIARSPALSARQKASVAESTTSVDVAEVDSPKSAS